MEVEAQPSDGLVLRGIILCSLEVVILQTDTHSEYAMRLRVWSVRTYVKIVAKWSDERHSPFLLAREIS